MKSITIFINFAQFSFISLTQNLAFQFLIFLFETKGNNYKKLAPILDTIIRLQAKYVSVLKWILNKFKVGIKINIEKFFCYLSMRTFKESIFCLFLYFLLNQACDLFSKHSDHWFLRGHHVKCNLDSRNVSDNNGLMI